jgi:hypothetical protein
MKLEEDGMYENRFRLCIDCDFNIIVIALRLILKVSGILKMPLKDCQLASKLHSVS